MSTDMTRAMQDVRDKIAQVRPGFPRDVKDPLVIRVDQENQQPVVSLAVLSPTMDLRELTSLTDQTIVKALENVPGVARDRRQRPRDAADPDPDQAERADGARHRRRPGDQRDPRGEPGRPGRPHHARPDATRSSASRARSRIPRSSPGSSSRSRAARRSTCRRSPTSSTARRRRTRSRAINGRPVDHARHPEGAGREHRRDRPRHQGGVALLKTRLPSDVELRVAYSTADTVERAVNRVKQTIVEGGLLTVLIVFLFLHSWRSTIITGLTLPIAVIATFIALYAFGFTLNFLTLMALSLCIGLLIDDAIVVRENIVRHLGLGKDHVTAAREGTDEIGLAVMATTFAIVAVFVPIAFMSGIIGRFFFQFGVTVAVAVLVSLFVSLHARPDAVVGLARSAGLALQARAVARPVHGQGRARHRVAARALRRDPRVGARPPQERARDRARRRSSRASRSCRWSAPSSSRRPTRASSRCGSTRRSGRASSTPTARCGRSRPR